jgi:hypothetical protein
MSLATSSMTDNDPPPLVWQPTSAPLKPLSLAMPWQQSNNVAQTTSDKLALSSSLAAFSLASAAPALAQWGQQWSQAQTWPLACGQQLGQPCCQPCGQPCAHTFGQAFSEWPAATGAWPAATGATAVDMLVLPSSEACSVQSSDSKQDMVKVTYR